MLDGLLGADVVSFHTEEYRDNFLRTCARVIDGAVVVDGSLVRHDDGRTVRALVNPISIDTETTGRDAVSRAVERRLIRLQEDFRGRRVVLGVDRLDYTKGIPERLRAIEVLLEVNPHRRADLTFVQLAVPSRGDIREYEELRSTVEQLVGRVNGRFTAPDHHVPVHYLYRSVSRDELLAYYRLADVCLVTPLADGMNLVAKEFVTTQGAAGGDGVLVLSEFAGAIDELPEALPVQPVRRARACRDDRPRAGADRGRPARPDPSNGNEDRAGRRLRLGRAGARGVGAPDVWSTPPPVNR